MSFLGSTTVYYGGGQVAAPINLITHIRGKPPATFKAPLGTISLDYHVPEAWMLVADASGNGVWASITGGTGGNVDTLTGNTGGAVGPLAGNIDVVGTGAISVSGNPGTNTLTISSSVPAGVIETLTGNTGGAVPPDGGGNLSVIGSGSIVVAGSIGSNTLTISSTSPAGFAWNNTTTTPINIVPNNGYTPALGSLTTFVLPSICAYGQVMEIGGIGLGPWLLMQNAGQSVLVGANTTTVGVGGSISSTSNRDCIRFLCVQANTQFLVLSSMGNLTVV